MNIGQVFDELADGYTKMMEEMVPHYRQLLMSMLTYLPKNFVPDRILDLGCGNGNVTAICRAVYPEAHYHLVDASEEMISLCQSRFGTTGVTYEQLFFQDMSLENGAYDLVTAGFSLHHVPAEEKRVLFKVLHHGLSPRGYLTSADLLVNKNDEPYHSEVLLGWKSFLRSNGRSSEDWDWMMDHYGKYDHPSAYRDQKEWLEEAGFDEIQQSWHRGPWSCFHARK